MSRGAEAWFNFGRQVTMLINAKLIAPFACSKPPISGSSCHRYTCRIVEVRYPNACARSFGLTPDSPSSSSVRLTKRDTATFARALSAAKLFRANISSGIKSMRSSQPLRPSAR